MKLTASARLDDAATFVAVIEEGRLRKAAQRLGVAPATVSERITRLEAALGQRLLERTSRSLAPTEEGHRLFEQLRNPVRAAEEALTNVGTPDALPGTLRLSAPPGTAALFLDALISNYLATHPNSKAEVVYEDRKVDATAERFDLVVRSEALLDADSHARTVGPVLRPVVIAAPDYLARNGTPNDPADLVKHKAVLWQPVGASRPIRWAFTSGTGEAVSVVPANIATVSELGSVLALVSAGHGLGYVYEETVREQVRAGRIIVLMRSHTTELPRYALAYTRRHQMPARVRAFLDLVARS